MSDKRRHLGKVGEEYALSFLKKNGHHIEAVNFRTRSGEIDIITSKDDTIIFVEVKTRKTSFLESPFDAVTTRKKHQISFVALEYLNRKNIHDINVRFDVISIIFDDNNRKQVDHLENAFELSYGR